MRSAEPPRLRAERAHLDPAPSAAAPARAAARLRVEGMVQGVGFRPFVHALARRLGLAGSVANDSRGVRIEIEGSPGAVRAFRERLTREAPPLAAIARVAAVSIPVRARSGFTILTSRASGTRRVPVSPDIATCEDCLRELFDPRDRRHLYPFTNCTNCGPRFTIVRDVPYDRRRTTMAAFAMCGACAREYADPADRRFHAQPISCPACGPTLRLADGRGHGLDGEPIATTAALLRAGKIVAIKGLGGYHLAVDARNAAAVACLRARKHREERPFAVMVRSVADARAFARIDAAEEASLTSPRRPIVLLCRRDDAPALAPAVAPGDRSLGLLLPYTPVHHLLCTLFDGPLVLTSGNVSNEPIAYGDDDAFARLGSIADVFLTHDRPIETRTDDSVVRIVRGRELPLRRARGYAPRPIALPLRAPRPILACGAELKNTFCLVQGADAYVSHHGGDLENYETLCAFTHGIEHFQRLFAIRPAIVAYDLHPEYLPTKYALARTGVTLVGVQHHHAHVAACLADNAERGPAIGVAFDGLGYGTDGTMWGGEILVADLARCERVAHLDPVPLPGGAAAIREPWRMAAAYLAAAFGDALPAGLAVRRRHEEGWERVAQVARTRFSPPTSSVGRLFDAVAAILGVRDAISYEGQAAIELEQRADVDERAGYRAALVGTAPIRIRGADLVRGVVDDLGAGTAPSRVAGRFHDGLARAVADVCDAVRARRGLGTVALSGGVFQNALLSERVSQYLEARGFRVLTHSRVPCNDGGISFGQAAVAAARAEEHSP